MNRRQRQVARLRRDRQDATEMRGVPTDDRRPLQGFAGSYEITRKGDVFSVRLGRFIKHSYYPGFGGESGHAYIRIAVGGTTHKLSINQAVVDAWLSPVAQAELAQRFGEFVGKSSELFSRIQASGVIAETGIHESFLGAMVRRARMPSKTTAQELSCT